MLKNTKLVAGVIVLAVLIVIVAIWNSRRGGEGVSIDLLAQLGDAQKRSTWTQTTETLFGVNDTVIDGKTHKASSRLQTHASSSRLKCRAAACSRCITPSERTRGRRKAMALSSGLACPPTVGPTTSILREAVNPKSRERDRKWLPATIDLSAYEGQMVEIVLSTDTGPPGSSDARGDFCLWGDPKVKGR